MSYSNPSPETGPRVTRDQMRDVSSLRRARDNKMIAGVAEGLGRHFDVDPLLIRVVLAALTLFGGAGIAIYVIAWITIPEEGEQDSALSKLFRGDATKVMIAGLAVAAVIGVATMVGAIGFSAPNPVPVIVVSGLAIGALALFSRGRRQDSPPEPPQGYAPPQAYAPPQPMPAGTYAETTSEMTRAMTSETATGVSGDPATETAETAPEAVTEAATEAVTDGATDAATEESTGAPGHEWWRYPAPAGPGGPGPLPPPQAYVPPPPLPPRPPRSHLFGITMGVTAIALGVLWILNLTVYEDMPASVYPGTVLGITALALIVSAWVGRSRLLILVGLIASLMTVGLAVVGDGPYGQQIFSPTTADSVKSEYRHGVGQMVVHLEDVTDPESLDGRTVHLDQRIGQLQVIVPSTLPVVIDAHVDHGEISGPARGDVSKLNDGGEEISMSSVASGSPILRLDVDLDFGQILITQYDCPVTGSATGGTGLATTSRIGGFHAAPACN